MMVCALFVMMASGLYANIPTIDAHKEGILVDPSIALTPDPPHKPLEMEMDAVFEVDPSGTFGVKVVQIDSDSFIDPPKGVPMRVWARRTTKDDRRVLSRPLPDHMRNSSGGSRVEIIDSSFTELARCEDASSCLVTVGLSIEPPPGQLFATPTVFVHIKWMLTAP